jgi:hypothetical protein
MGRVVSGYRVKLLGPRPTRHTIGLGSGFLVVIFGLVGFFLDSSENFRSCPTRRTVWSGFFGWVDRATHDHVYIHIKIN